MFDLRNFFYDHNERNQIYSILVYLNLFDSIEESGEEEEILFRWFFPELSPKMVSGVFSDHPCLSITRGASNRFYSKIKRWLVRRVIE